MKINEIMKPSKFVVKNDDKDSTELYDPESGTTTIIDKRKNPQAIDYDEKSKTAVVKAAGAKKPGLGGKTGIKPGTKVSFEK